MYNKLSLVFLIFISIGWTHEAGAKGGKGGKGAKGGKGDKDVENEMKRVLELACCEKDFTMLVLSKVDDCMKMTVWQFKESPVVVCRRKIFALEGPSNDERRSRCTEGKEQWLECMEQANNSTDIKLKDEFNDAKNLKKFPKEKMECFRDALADIEC